MFAYLEGPTKSMHPREHTGLDYLQQLWSTHLFTWIMGASNALIMVDIIGGSSPH